MRDLLKDWQVLLYIFLAIASIVYIGYLISQTKVIVSNSNIIQPGEVILKIGDCPVKTLSDYYHCLSKYSSKQYILVTTNKNIYRLNASEIKNITVREESGIHFGIDLIGGVRVVLEPEKNISYSDLLISAQVIEKRINPEGLKEINVRVSSTPEGKHYIIVEFPESELSLLNRIKQQGKFEAKIGNVTVFTGGDIKYVYTDPMHAGIRYCYETRDKYNGQQYYVCEFWFGIVLSKKAAEKFAEVTKNLTVKFEPSGLFLSKTLDLYLDNKKMTSLQISADLKGKVVQEVSISGSGIGKTRREAYKNALKEMRDLQVILASGSLPVKFKIVRIDKISPTIGKIILKNILFVGLLAFLGVSLLVFLTYRNLKAALLVIINILIEVIVIFAAGVALGQTIDIPSLAGILIAIGTGVDDLAIAINEILRGKREMDLEKKISKVNFVIISSLATNVVAMLPLISVGLGFLRGFAIMTIIGVLIGAFITRPAFIKIAQGVI